METTIKRMLLELGIPASIKGHSRLVCAISIAAEDPTAIEAITKCLYPEVAKRFGDTPPRVERAIRHAIELSADRCLPDAVKRYFGNSISARKGKPTNSEFIARLADAVREGM